MNLIQREGFRNTKLRFKNIQKTLRRHKNKSHPKKPRSIKSVRDAFLDPQIMHDYGYNLEHDSKLYIDTVITKEYGFTLFASQFTIDFIKENIKRRKYLMDGTFDSLPENYYQLLIIAIEYRNDVSS